MNDLLQVPLFNPVIETRDIHNNFSVGKTSMLFDKRQDQCENVKVQEKQNTRRFKNHLTNYGVCELVNSCSDSNVHSVFQLDDEQSSIQNGIETKIALIPQSCRGR